MEKPIVSLFLLDDYSDVKLQIVESDEIKQIIPAHKAILIQNSEYFEGKFRDMKKMGLVLAEDEALVVDVKGLGTVQDVLDILTLFYLSVGKLVEKENPFKDLNPNILDYFMIRDVIFERFDIFENFTFKSSLSSYHYLFNGLFGNLNLLQLNFEKYSENDIFVISFIEYRKPYILEGIKIYNNFFDKLKNFLDENNINYEIIKDFSTIDSLNRYNMPIENLFVGTFRINISNSKRENVKLLFDEIIKKTDDEKIISMLNRRLLTVPE